MKRLLVTIVLLLIAGCVPTAEDIGILTNDVDLLQGEIDNVQTMLAKSKVLNKEQVAKVNETIDKVQEQILVVNEAVKEKGDGTLVEKLEAGITASKPFNPYADEMNAILALVAVVGGVFVKKKMDERDSAEAKRQADKVGREKTLRDIAALTEAEITAPLVKKLMYENIGNERKANGIH